MYKFSAIIYSVVDLLMGFSQASTAYPRQTEMTQITPLQGCKEFSCIRPA